LVPAVMTAFLVESYAALSRDPNDLMIILLQQVALQLATNSYPSVNAVRVNVLWLASSTPSLVSASYGILVKQWLHNYLARKYTSPQARLRVRHFRNPGPEHWKVFEIATKLLLLLQPALALLLIGLCIFTAEVHSSIGHTTVPVVAG
ncbi:hypothetical protein BC835DRAFT_1281393, partial [Cytidiella melzeri]